MVGTQVQHAFKGARHPKGTSGSGRAYTFEFELEPPCSSYRREAVHPLAGQTY
jgi:hypothetical protein